MIKYLSLADYLVIAERSPGGGGRGDQAPARYRYGRDAFYSVVFVAWVLLIAAGLAAWTAVASTTAHQLTWPTRILRLEVRLGVAVTAAMAVMTIATAIWWVTLAQAAPWFFDGHPLAPTPQPSAPTSPSRQHSCSAQPHS